MVKKKIIMWCATSGTPCMYSICEKLNERIEILVLLKQMKLEQKK